MIDPGAFSLGPVGGTGPALLCLHGLTGTPYEVRAPAERLAPNGIACLGPLLPGHGETPEVLAATPRSAWLGAALEAHDRLASTHDRVYIAGLSLGGLLALHVAAERPVAGVIAYAAPLEMGYWVRTLAPWAARFVSELPKTPAIQDSAARDRHPGYRRIPLRSVCELLELQRDLRPRLERVIAPVLLIYSHRDPTVSPANAALIRDAVSSQRRDLVMLESSAHVLTVDVERERVLAETESFIRKLEHDTVVDGSR